MNMNTLTRTVKIKLPVKPEQIRPTFEAVTQAFNYVCQVGYEDRDFNSVSLHHKTYKHVRATFGLPADLAVQSRMKASEALKAAIKKGRKCPGSKLSSIRYSARSFSIWFDRGEMSILTLDGRIRVSFNLPDYYQQYVSWRRKGAELILRKGRIFLCIVFQKDVPEFEESGNPVILGIDRGVNKIAVCSDNKFYNRAAVAHRYQRLRRELQKCGSKSAKRHLRKMASKENRFRRDANHCITKKIVESLPENSIIVLEDLKYIRKRVKLHKHQRRKVHAWSFYQFEQFLTYKADAKSIKVDHVDARYTSQKCSRCGYISRSNRTSQAVFKCTQCGLSLNADLNASRNIEANYRDAKGYPEGLSVNKPDVGSEAPKRLQPDCGTA